MSRNVRLLILLAILLGMGEIALVLLKVFMPDQFLAALLVIWGCGLALLAAVLWRRFLPPEK